MDEIPEDVLKAAKKAAYACEETGDGEAALTSFIGVRAVCAAILAERKRCADVARHLNGWGYPPAPALADHIARIIESGQ